MSLVLHGFPPARSKASARQGHTMRTLENAAMAAALIGTQLLAIGTILIH